LPGEYLIGGPKVVVEERILDRRLSRRAFLGRSARCLAGAGLTGVSGLGYAAYIEPNWVDVRQVSLTLPKLPAAFRGYRLAQISDIHLDGVSTTRSHLSEVIELVNREQPDLVANTGDFETHAAQDFAPDLIDSLRALRTKDGVVAVLGNHDHWSDPAAIRRVLSKCNITDLSNDVFTLTRGEAHFHIAGVDDVWEGRDRLDLVLRKLPVEGGAILLAHEPDFADTSSATARFDLQLSGHSHGGQVSIPLFGPPRLPLYGRKYPSGLYMVGEMLHYTNRGIGMVRPYVRFNCRPEITLFTLN
jgi:predicted MPP superfamily phosphohydrolase